MNQPRDIEGLLDQWFADGSSIAPDRVIDIVADRIERKPQRPAWRLDWRHLSMTTTVKFAAAVAAVAVVSVIGFSLLPGASTGVGAPVPSATPTASPTPTPAPTASPAPTPSPTPEALLNAKTEVFHPFESNQNFAVRIPVPAGWSEVPEWALIGPKGLDAPEGIGLAILRANSLYSNPCHPSTATGDEPVGAAVDDFATALVGHRGYVASSPSPVSLAGYSGLRMDLQLPDLGSCTGEIKPFDGPDGGLYAQGSNAIWRLWILDVAGNRVIVLIGDYAGTPAADRAVAEAVVNAIEFVP